MRKNAWYQWIFPQESRAVRSEGRTSRSPVLQALIFICMLLQRISIWKSSVFLTHIAFTDILLLFVCVDPWTRKALRTLILINKRLFVKINKFFIFFKLKFVFQTGSLFLQSYASVSIIRISVFVRETKADMYDRRPSYELH